MARSRKRHPTVVCEADRTHAFPGIANIACRAPAMAEFHPQGCIGIGSIVRDTVYDIASTLAQRVVHLLGVMEIIG